MTLIRYRIAKTDPLPLHGEYLVAKRAAYLILRVNDRGMRGGLGKPVYRLVHLTVERAPRDQALASGYGWLIEFDRRKRRPAKYPP